MPASAAKVGRKVICPDGWRVTMHVEVRRGPLQGPDSERQGPTNRMSAAMFSGSPHSTRATTSDRTERQVTSKAADEATGTRRSTRSASTRISLPARCSERRPAADDPDPAPATAPGGGHRWPGHRLRDHPLRVNRMVAASATHPTAPQAPEPFRDPPGEAIGVATSAGQAEGETYALLVGSGFIAHVMSLQRVDPEGRPD